MSFFEQEILIMGRIADITHSLINMVIDTAEESIPVEERVQTAQDRDSDRFRQMAGNATKVGRQAEIITQQLAYAQSQISQYEDGIRFHVNKAKEAAASGDAEAEHQHTIDGQLMASDLADAKQDVAQLEAMAKVAVENKNDAYQMVLRQARDLARQAAKDNMTVLRARVAAGRRDMIELQEQLMPAFTGDRSTSRARIEKSVDNLTAETEARSQLFTALMGQQRRVEDVKDEQAAIAGQAEFARIAGEQGYEPKALPAAGGTTPSR